jgi:hypothetical protein
MKYNEDDFLDDALEYIKGTYTQHYVSGSDKDLQLIDLWAARNSALETSLNTAMKYILRYGKKNGYNKLDLLKAIHYITFVAYFTPKGDVNVKEKKQKRT